MPGHPDGGLAGRSWAGWLLGLVPLGLLGWASWLRVPGLGPWYPHKILKRKCSEMQTQRQLKKSQYRFCKNIFTLQTYEMEEDRKEKKNKPYRKYNKRYFLKRSTRRKPYLDPDRCVRKYNPKRIYKNKLNCYACGEPDHLSTNCPIKKNLYNTRSMLL